MADIIQLKKLNGDSVYVASNSNSIKISNENKNLTTKLQEIDVNINNPQINIKYNNEHKGYKTLNNEVSFSSQIIDPNTTYEIKDAISLGSVENLTLTLDTKIKYGGLHIYLFCTTNLAEQGKGIIIEDEDVYFFKDIPTVSDIEIQNNILSNTYASANSSIYVAKRFLKEDLENVNSIELNVKKVNVVNIPENCTLKFNGGKISNGIIVGNNTSIEANSSDYIFDNIQTLGDFNCDAYVDWFGAKCSNSNSKTIGNSDKIQRAFRSSFGAFKFNKGYYYVDNTIRISRPISIMLDGVASQPIKSYRKRIIENQENFYPIQGSVIWSDLDLDIFLIQIQNKTTPTEKLNINISGGCFDVSQSTNFSHSVLHVIPGYGVNLYPYFSTTLYGANRQVTGTYAEFNLCTGNGIQFTCLEKDSGTCYGGYINCEIFRFLNAVKHDDNYKSSGEYITNIEYDCYIDGCAVAYDFGQCGNIGGKVKGFIQACYYFEENNTKSIMTGVRNVYLNPKIWDINYPESKKVIGNSTYYFPRYAFDLAELTASQYPNLGENVKILGTAIKGYENIRKNDGFFNTNSIAENPTSPYLGLFDNVLYRYDSLPDYNEVPNVQVLAKNCQINTNELFGTKGASITKYRKDAEIIITINNIEHYLTKLSKVFINYVKGWDPWEDYPTPSYGIPAFKEVIVQTYNSSDELLETFNLGECDKAKQVNQAASKYNPGLLNSNTNKVVVTLSKLTGANYKTSYYNENIYDDVGEDDYLNYRGTFYISIEGQTRDFYRNGINHLTRKGFKINNKSIVLNDFNITAANNIYYPTTSGNSNSRPSSENINAGFQYFDTSLNIPIWFNGSVWVDSQGNTV